MRPGDVLGARYELERLAGSGGMGEVFRARDGVSGQTVAIKVLRPDNALGKPRFEREARVLSELSHPGIVRYIAHGAAPSGEPYLVMEWLEGEDLQSRLLRGALTVEETVTLARCAAAALAAAHDHGVIHRDLKPTNLFLVGLKVDQVKLLDFGIARLSSGTHVTQTGVLVGTPGYMAPEQARTDLPVDVNADVFSLGCIVFECLIRKPAFAGDHLMAVLAKILVEDPPRVRSLRPEVPADLDALVACMLAKAPDERPRDGAAVARALANLGAAGDPAPSAPPDVRCGHPALTRSERRALSVVMLGKEPKADIADMQTLGRTELAAAQGELRREVEAYGARLELLADGGAVVTFAGAGMPTDQAVQAARCALALRRFSGGRQLSLATGHGELTDRMPLGDAIDRAARMLASCVPLAASSPPPVPPVAVDEVTAAFLDARFEVRETVAGLELMGEREVAAGARTLLGRTTPCVGRDRELAALEQILAGCVEEPSAQAVLVTAPAGMGKSRLAHEFLDRVHRRGEDVDIWFSRGDAMSAGSTFGLLGQALRGISGFRSGESLAVRLSRIRARVAQHVLPAEQQRVAEFLAEIAGVPFPDEESIPLRSARKDARLMGDQMRRAWEDFVAAECSARPVLLVLEDLHWGDLPSVQLVDAALRSSKEMPWLVLALARPEVHEIFPRLWAGRAVQEIRLKHLSRRASERLARQVLGDAVSPGTVERLVAQSEGNAFYLEELIRAVAERRGETLPATLVAMVQSRIGELTGEVRRVLRAASIFGEAFWPGGLAALLGSAETPAQIAHRLAELVDQEVLIRQPESRFPGEEEFAFRHALLREGVYAMLTDGDRALGHRLAGEWLLQRGGSDPMLLAEHFEHGGDLARAGRLYLRAAEMAILGGDSEAAIVRANRGLACGVPEEMRLAMLGLLMDAYTWRAEHSGAAAPYVDEVMQRSTPGSTIWARGAAARLTGAIRKGAQDEFITVLDQIKDVTPSPDAVGPITFILCTGVFYLDVMGRFEHADEVLRRIHAVVDPVVEREPIASGWLNVVCALREAVVKEDPWGGLRRAGVARAHFGSASHWRGMALAQVAAGMNLWQLGACEHAARELSTVMCADEELGEASSIRPFCLAWVLAESGVLAEARRCAARLLDSGGAPSLPLNVGRGRWALAEVLRREGDLDAAESEALGALDLLAISPAEHVAATATLAAIRLAQGRSAQALADAQDAMTRYTSGRVCGFFRGQFVHLVHAECLHAAGNHEAALDAIVGARDHLLANADKIEDTSLRRCFLDGVSENVRTLELARQWIGSDIARQGRRDVTHEA